MENKDAFSRMLEMTNEHTIGVHMHNNGWFTLYCEDGQRRYRNDERGYLKAIEYMEKL